MPGWVEWYLFKLSFYWCCVESIGIIHGWFRFSSDNNRIFFVHKVQIMCQLNSRPSEAAPERQVTEARNALEAKSRWRQQGPQWVMVPQVARAGGWGWDTRGGLLCSHVCWWVLATSWDLRQSCGGTPTWPVHVVGHVAVSGILPEWLQVPKASISENRPFLTTEPCVMG